MNRVSRLGAARILIIVLALVTAGCGDSSSGGSTTTGPPATTTVAETTTTTLPSGITVDPNLPPASAGDALRWGDVGPGWYLVLYDASRAYPVDAGDTRPGPRVLYVVDPAGRLYEVASWPPSDSYMELVDAVGTKAIILDSADDDAWHFVELTTGATTVIPEIPFRRTWGIDLPPVRLTRPDGDRLIVYRSRGATEWLELRTVDGSMISVLFERPTGSEYSLSWAQSPDGEHLVVGSDDGMALITGDGSKIRDLGAPDDHRCVPMRWWDPDSVLAACYGNDTSAPLDDYGNRHTYYGSVWLIGTDGTSGTPLTSILDEPITVVDFGYRDALRVDGTILLQWTGDCGAAAVGVLQPDGSGPLLGPVETPSMWIMGYRMIGAVGRDITVYGWESCDAYVGTVFVIDTEGTFLRELAPRFGDGRGVIGVMPLG